MTEPHAWLSYLTGAAVSIPLLLAAAALAAPHVREATRVTYATFVLALSTAAMLGASAHLGVAPAPRLLRLDGVTAVLLVLVCSLAVVVARYSRSYLRGDVGRARYDRYLLGTLASVTTLVVANDLLVIAASWTGTSLCLHQLLTFQATRTPAIVAAHKKFLVSRLADALVLGAIGLTATSVGSVRLDAIHAAAEAQPTLPPSLHAAAVLLVLATVLKSGQLPFHGWLTQVMEAPTPVSALLHAGVVNLGGIVMIRLAPLVSRAELAEGLLLTFGLTTSVVAGLVLTTRVSVKVALAWSTIAQMGFMLTECALGAYHLALLHLVAHSLYKAHAFLRSGSAVDDFRARRALVAGPAPIGALLARCGALAACFVGWHAAASSLFPELARPWASPAGWAAVASSLAGTYLLSAVLRARPQGRLARYLHPRLFAGLHLDEVFTRLTFRLWPPRFAPASRFRDVTRATAILEA